MAKIDPKDSAIFKQKSICTKYYSTPPAKCYSTASFNAPSCVLLLSVENQTLKQNSKLSKFKKVHNCSLSAAPLTSSAADDGNVVAKDSVTRP